MPEQLKPVIQNKPGSQNPKTTGSNPVLKPPPARRPVLPVSHNPRKKKRSVWRKCCCATCLVLLVLILLIAVTGCVMYLILEPRVPVFHLQAIRFVRFNVSDSVDGAVLVSEALVRIQIKNRNRVLRVNYGKTRVVLSSGEVDFGTGSLRGFSQAKKNTTVLKFTTKVKGELLNSGSGKKMSDGYKSKGLKLETEVNSEVGVGTKKWNTIKFPIKATCEGVSLKNLQRGSSVPKCKITVLRIFNI